MSLVAHSGRPLAPHDLWQAWDLHPALVLGLLVTAWAYQRGRSGPGQRGPGAWRAWCFAGALVALVVALVSPLDALAGSLASAHMVQHVLLVLVAAPLLALSSPASTLLRGSPLALRRAGGRLRRAARGALGALRHPALVWLLHVGTLWAWHAAVPYGAALESDVVHALEHAGFLVTGVLFWHVAIGARASERAPHGLGVLLVFAMAMQSTFLAALLTFARTPWYDAYATTTASWGLEPLADQQLAGVIMWVPAGVVYLAAGLGLMVAWLRESEPGDPRPAAEHAHPAARPVAPMPGRAG